LPVREKYVNDFREKLNLAQLLLSILIECSQIITTDVSRCRQWRIQIQKRS
jgi:hypothetical protein